MIIVLREKKRTILLAGIQLKNFTANKVLLDRQRRSQQIVLYCLPVLSDPLEA